jgi:hypothetical protein
MVIGKNENNVRRFIRSSCWQKEAQRKQKDAKEFHPTGIGGRPDRVKRQA